MITLSYALLGLLAREPLAGYDLAQRLKERVGFFWHARHSQIYPELARLAEQGLVSHQRVEQENRPAKKLYTITTQGHAALRAWATQPPASAAGRDELVLKAYCLWVAAPSHIHALFREQERQHAAQLAHYEAIGAWMEREWGSVLQDLATPEFSSYAALQRGVGYEREYMAWCRWIAERVEQS